MGQREHKTRLEAKDYLQELEAFRRQDVNGVNAILFEKLNATRSRIAELETSHQERLDVISRMQVSSINAMAPDTLLNNPMAVTECQTELGELMSVVGSLHEQLRLELD